MTRTRKNLRKVTDIRKTREFAYFLEKIMTVAQGMFQWVNLPEYVDSRFIELALMSRGEALFFKDDVLNLFCCIYNNEYGQYDIYGEPYFRVGVCENSYTKNVDRLNSVIIHNNIRHTPEIMSIEYHAERCARLRLTADVNLNAQKTPFFIKCSQEQRNTMLNFWEQYNYDNPLIFASDNFAMDNVQVFQTNTPFIVPSLQDEIDRELNNAYADLGVGNTNLFKKERSITPEINLNMEPTYIVRQQKLNERKKACREINEMFGLNIDVIYNSEIESFLGGEKVGNIYDIGPDNMRRTSGDGVSTTTGQEKSDNINGDTKNI